MGSTLSEKILALKTGASRCCAGDIVECKIDLVIAHDATVKVLPIFHEMGGESVWNPERIVMLIDHWTPAVSEATAKNQRTIRRFVREQNLNYFYGSAEGVCHQVLADYGHVRPGMLILGTDSHTCTSGAFGAFAAGMGTTDMAAVFLDGKTWLRVPETIRFELTGQTRPWVMSKDVILHLLRRFGTEYALYKTIEFGGDYIRRLSMSGRMTICNMGAEMGCKTAIVMPDATTSDYLKSFKPASYQVLLSDENASFVKKHTVDVSGLCPQVALPHSPGNVVDISEVEGTEVDQVFLGSCTNGRLEDLAIAARILQGKHVSGNVRLIVTPASRLVYLEAVKRGYTQYLLEAGALITNPGCGACFGGHGGLLAAGERCLATTNRNFRGRMGSTEAEIYLASPATAAATSLTGRITSAEAHLCD
jgi:3-isopropylmalate/(R)-2-methylmalate dehydratase large subunit